MDVFFDRYRFVHLSERNKLTEKLIYNELLFNNGHFKRKNKTRKKLTITHKKEKHTHKIKNGSSENRKTIKQNT